MPNLTLSVTTAQAARIAPALAAKYMGGPLGSAPMADQVTAFLMSAMREMVLAYERNKAFAAATAAAALVPEL